MPKVTDEHREAMRSRIQDAAIASFTRKGFSGASMADIVNEAELSAGAVYVYYSSKAELMIDVGRRIMERRVTTLEDYGSAEVVPPPREVFTALFNSLVEDSPFAPVVLQVWGEAVHNEGFGEIASSIFGELIGYFSSYLNAYFSRTRGFDEEAARAKAEETAPAYLALMQGAIVQVSIFGPERAELMIRSVAALLADLER